MATVVQELAPAISAPARTDDRFYRLSIEQYDRMVALGILRPGDRCFLLDGILVAKMAKGDPHTTSVLLSTDTLRGVLPAGWHVRQEGPVDLPDGPGGFDSVPEPDVSLARGTIRDYAAKKPLPTDLALVVEVADSSLLSDRKKLVRYAWCGVPVAWIVNLDERIVEVYSSPSGPADEPGYRESRTFGESDSVPVILDGVEVGRVAVRDLLP